MKIKWILDPFDECVTFKEPNEDIFDITIEKDVIYLGLGYDKYSKFIKRMKFKKVF